jgi:predicted nucleic acid-binding protein
LAIEIGADVVLMDEYRGRAVAKAQGLAVTGLVGVIIAAKANGLLPSVKLVRDALRATAGFRLSDSLYASALASVGESN